MYVAGVRLALNASWLTNQPFQECLCTHCHSLRFHLNGYRFVLILVDYAMRYPEAVPLRTISAKSFVQALFQVIS